MSVQQTLAENSRPAIVVVDPMVLRRASLVGFLRDWAEASRVSITPLAPDMLQTAVEAGTRFTLGVLNLGGASVAEPAPLGWLKRMMGVLPETPVAVVSDRDDTDEVVAALRAGAQAFIPTSTEPAVVLRALSFIMGGGSFFPPAALLGRLEIRWPRGPRGRAPPPNGDLGARPSPLTARQEAVLKHLRDGKSNKAIAKLLGMEESTVKVHMRQVMKRLGVSNRTQAALTVDPPGAAPGATSGGTPLLDVPIDLVPHVGMRPDPCEPPLRARRAPGLLAVSG